MALTSITRDFVVRSGALVEGTRAVSSSTGQTGTLQVNGGAAIAKNLIVGTTATIWGDAFVRGQFTVQGTTTVGLFSATSFTAESALIEDNAQVNGLFTASGATTLGNTLDVTGNATFSGSVFVTGTNFLTVGTGSTNLGGTLEVAGVTSITNNTTANDAGTGALVVQGGAYIADNLLVKSIATNTATNTDNALFVAGGAWVEKDFTVGGKAIFRDDVVFSGAATYVNSTNTVYTDNIIELHTPPGGPSGVWPSDDGKDIGLRFHYYTGASDANAALVLANDTKYLEFYNSGAESGNSFAGASYGTFKTAAIKLVGGTSNGGNTSTGDLAVLGGVGIGGEIYVGGNASVANATIRNLTTATGIVYSDGTGNLLNSPVLWNSGTGRLQGTIDYANTSTNVAGGATGSLLYQTNANETSSLPIGTNGYILSSVGGNPTWVTVDGLSAGTSNTATNIAGGLANQIPYQTGPGNTSFNVNLRFNGTTFTTTNIVLTGGTNATSTGTGALTILGGVGISRDLWVGGDITVAGNINFDGAGADTLTATTGTFAKVNVTGTGVTLVVADSAEVGGTLYVGGEFTATGTSSLQDVTASTLTATILIATSNAEVGGTLEVTGHTTFEGVTSTGATGQGNLVYSDSPEVSGTLLAANINATGYSTLGLLTATVFTATSANILGTLAVTGYSTLGLLTATVVTATSLTVGGNGSIGGTFGVTGATTVGLLTATVFTATSANILGTLAVTGYSTLGLLTATVFTATSLTVGGNGSIGGTFGVTGAATFNSVTATLFTATSLTVGDGATIGGSLGVTGDTTLSNTLQVNNETESASTTQGSIVTTGGVGIAKSVTVGGAITVGTTAAGSIVNGILSNNNLQASYTSNSITTSALQSLDSFTGSVYRSAKYVVQIVDGTKIHVQEMLLFHDGTNAFLTEYAVVTSQGELGTFDAVYSSGTMTLNFTPNYDPDAMVIKIVRTSITA